MNNLILVRHGQSLWNKERKFTGFMDIELTEKGKSEARYAGQLIWLLICHVPLTQHLPSQ